MNEEEFLKALLGNRYNLNQQNANKISNLRDAPHHFVKDTTEIVSLMKEADTYRGCWVTMSISNQIFQGLNDTGNIEIELIFKMNSALFDEQVKDLARNDEGSFIKNLKRIIKHLKKNDNYLEAQEEMKEYETKGKVQ